MVKILITTIQVNVSAALIMTIQVNVSAARFLTQNLPELLLLNFLPSQPFLGRHLGFHIFFTIAFLRATLFFHSLAVLD